MSDAGGMQGCQRWSVDQMHTHSCAYFGGARKKVRQSYVHSKFVLHQTAWIFYIPWPAKKAVQNSHTRMFA